MTKTGVALLGLGTVGGGTYRILKNNYESIKLNYGVDIEIRHIIEKDMKKVQELGVDGSIVSCDIENVINDPEIKIVAEFFGGIEPAKSYIIKCLLAGKTVVTANKEMFAKYWHELQRAAKKGRAGLYFEASCVGGVPIIRTLTESMQGNNILCIMGIVNGTTNYILSKMADEGLEYKDVLKEAQKLGYAEQDPTADVEGYDSMYKLSILSSLAFHTRVPVDKIYREGISSISKTDIEFGKRFGYTLKLLAIGKRTHDNKIEVRVHPAFISNKHPLAAVKGSFNAVHILGDNVGDIMLYGRGAGDLPTGSAIVSDIVYAAQQRKHEYTSFRNTLSSPSKYFSKDFECEYYIRMTVKDLPGVIASVSSVFGRLKISINSIQQELMGDKAYVIFMLHKTHESAVKKAMSQIEKLSVVESVDSIIRVE
ncbi:MAG: homoserine dehydrogenase [Bacillota bacterium]|jgi:homoserine dehydrogenase|nr:homoserine dehydrogenase [Bacillota bacterium]HHU43027.1 homoserine dehydrogenase [Clostridiales bacterium]